MRANTASAAAAQPVPTALIETPRGTDQYVTFTSNGGHYAVDIMSVREIRSWQPTTPLPGRTTGARGVLDIRGKVVEVFDLSLMLGGPQLELGAGNVVLVLALAKRTVGILVDSVSDIIQTGLDTLMSVPNSGLSSADTGQVGAMVHHDDRLIAILALERLFPG